MAAACNAATARVSNLRAIVLDSWVVCWSM